VCLTVGVLTLTEGVRIVCLDCGMFPHLGRNLRRAILRPLALPNRLTDAVYHCFLVNESS
jgi:hypothetical protein